MHSDLIGLLKKYDVPIPRYTSYPTVPYWDFNTLTPGDWKQSVINTYESEKGELCLYIHLPFCEELCTFCACNKRITKNHAVETPYLQNVLREWGMYFSLFESTPTLREIHLGGGTPTFFSPQNLVELIQGLTKNCVIPEDHEFSVEVHPNFTTKAHLEALQSVGFNRISIGVQDFDPEVQFIINRHQSFEKTKEVIDWARELGYFSVNLDLIYGLPKQNLKCIENTFEKVKELKPDRIAFYSYAHVPWKSKGQRRYTDEDVPKAEEKYAMYGLGNELLGKMGMISIGMDHFALPSDKLLLAYNKGEMHRNFMGYTTTSNKLVIGLGASSISDTWTAFAQNEKTVEAYNEKIQSGEWPIIQGHLLNDEDLLIRKHILNLMCKDSTVLNPLDFDTAFYDHILSKLKNYANDNLVEIDGNKISVTPKGKLFVRNISSAIDAYLYSGQSEARMFSQGI
ncbi:MAG TPA: oxygen-independent coproporphyrinogen III oxidase [Bacteroidetes bacterium]|nr:oxygen-independent coproporphyrinogen III oxidase [Bacteroidota bacterium]